MITINPYLVFKDNCEEAFTFYKTVFGGDLFMGRYKDVLQGNRQLFPLSPDENIMHATLQIDPQTALMGCDSLETYERSKGAFINNFFLYMSIKDQANTYRIFDELSIEGRITMPIAQTFWSTHYEMVVDKFGIHWKITFNSSNE